LCIVALVAAPATVRAEPVTCADGTTSESGRGACSHHGGIAKTRASREQPTEKRTRTTTTRTKRGVRCSDGTMSKTTGRGACSHHGGIADDGPIKVDRRDPFEPAERQSRTQRQDTRTPKRETRTDRPWWGSDEPQPGEPLARCMDGTLSYSKHHRGTCSQHGGVRDWLDD
jgi:hypothetical protein